MSEFYKIEGDELKVEIKGQPYTFRAPVNAEIKAVVAAMQSAGDDGGVDPIDEYSKFFVMLGLPKDVVEGMSNKALLNLFGYAVGAKKN